MVETARRNHPNPSVMDDWLEVQDLPGKEDPVRLLANDRRHKPGRLRTRYARRTLIENGLGERVEFFHVDALPSSGRIKVAWPWRWGDGQRGPPVAGTATEGVRIGQGP